MSALTPLSGDKRTRPGHCETDTVDPFLPCGEFCCDAQRCLLVGFVLDGQYCMRRCNFVAPGQRRCRLAARPKRRNSRRHGRRGHLTRSHRPTTSSIGRGNSYSRGATPFSIWHRDLKKKPALESSTRRQRSPIPPLFGQRCCKI